MNELRLITCIIEKGKGQDVTKAALEAGAKGATFFNGKGIGIRQSVLISIVPEKEIVLVVTKNQETDAVYKAMIEKAGLEDPGKGFIYVSKLEKAFGFLEDYPEDKLKPAKPLNLENVTLTLESSD